MNKFSPTNKTPLTLNDGEIHLWFTHPQAISDCQLLADYAQLLTPDETRKQQRYRFAKDQHDALITRAFVRELLSHYGDVAPADWRFAKGDKDKPEIVNPPLPLRFNISHTENMIICAVCLEHDVGCDVENSERNNDILAIADRYFSPSEIKELFSLDKSLQSSRFFDYWTLKESYIKACGQGLAIPLDHFSFHIQANTNKQLNPNIAISFAPERNDQSELWHSWLLYPNSIHRVAVSIKSNAAQAHSLRYFHSVPQLSMEEVDFLF